MFAIKFQIFLIKKLSPNNTNIINISRKVHNRKKSS